MITRVEDRNVVAIPELLAAQHGIKPGSQLDWTATDKPGVISVHVLPDYASLASSLMGAGQKNLQPARDPITELVRDRAAEERDRQTAL